MTEKSRFPYRAIDLATGLVSRLLPSGLRPTVEQLRRDAHRFVDRMAGKEISPFVTRQPPPEADAANAHPHAPVNDVLAPRPLDVLEVIRETADAVTLRLGNPDDTPFAVVPGQFFTVCVDVGAEHLRRAYSVSSSALTTDSVDITVKRVAGGRVSNWLNDEVRPGARVFVLGPSGSFIVRPDPAVARRLVLIGGGSGITPLMSIARTLLAVEKDTHIALAYGNRSEADIIFGAAISELASQYGARFSVLHTLEKPGDAWSGGRGLLDGKELLRQLATLPEAMHGQDVHYYLCGPEPMMNAAKTALHDVHGVALARIHEERFVNPQARSDEATGAASAAVTIEVTLAKKPHRVTVAPGQTILEAGLKAGLQMPFSCAMGGCAECQMKLVDGEMVMAEPNCLTPEERAQGLVLTCVGRPKTALRLER